MKVLYAEDEYTNRKLMEIQLRNMGIPCDLALDGASALEMFRQNQYNLVILDQYMPGLNGDAVAREIRKANPGIPLIAITSDDEEISNLQMAGFNHVFIKPLRGSSHLDVIRSYLS